jgi:uncharacterized membrane protein
MEANASLLDESTLPLKQWLYCLMFAPEIKKKSNVNKFFVSEEILPQPIRFTNSFSYQSRVSYWKPPRV